MSTQPVEKCTYLTFALGEEDFALKVNNVREVLDVGEITRIPRTPSYMRGVINLRGSVVPVVDMRIKLGLEAVQDTLDTCIIVVEIMYDGDAAVIGAVADSVKAVYELADGDIEPPPRIGTDLDTRYVSGMGKSEDGFMIILDIEEIFSSGELCLAAVDDPETRLAGAV